MDRTEADTNSSTLPYIEPSIRVIAGFLLTILGIIMYLYQDMLLLLLAILFFISINLFQSGFTRFCLMERLLALFGFRSELSEIKDLGIMALKSEAMQKSYIRTMNLLNEAVLELSIDGRIITASDCWLQMVNPDKLDMPQNNNLLTYIIDGDRESVATMLSQVGNSSDTVHKARFRLANHGDAERWIGGKFMLESSTDSNIHIRAILSDVTESYLQESKIQYMAMHDSLTGLPNRALLDERLEHDAAQAQRNSTKLGLLFIDLDNFKQINDIHGHKAGDHLLITVSHIMQLRLRSSDTLARWGGDEFVVLLPDIQHYSHLRDVAHALMHKLEYELEAENVEGMITLSIGGAIYPDDADSAESLLVQADKALYFAKDQGRNNVQIYTELRESNLGFYDFDMTNRFSQAVKNHAIQIYYQPIVSSDNESLCGFEALARWQDDKYGWVSPSVFIPMAENLGLIHSIGRHVVATSIANFASTAAAHDGLILSINISNRQLMQGDFHGWICSVVKDIGIRPEQIKLEITESLTQLGINRAREVLESLRVTGFILSLDDFGTGYSSLSHLHNLPVHELKIDMSFIKRFDSEDGMIMLETICAMGHSLGLQLVAEGVETQECADAMRRLKVDRLQGYYYDRPLPWDEAVSKYTLH
ncbi:MAG: EAL domain-containing protein [Chromatiales bacterium]|nr:EAL domain-containing protein [Chromatiales bacterium]